MAEKKKSVQTMRDELASLLNGLNLFTLNLVTIEEEKRENLEAEITKYEGKIADLQDRIADAELNSDSSSPQTLNRQAVYMTAAVKEIPKFDVGGSTITIEDWCEEVEKIERIHAIGGPAEKIREFYNQICGLLDTCTYDQWNNDASCDHTIEGLLRYLRLNFGERTSIYQMLHTVWSMEKSPTKNFKQTAAELQHAFTKVMKTVKATYLKSAKKDLDVDSFADIVCGMIFSDIARKADPQTFKLATRDMDEKFTAGDIAAVLKLYVDRNGETDNVTKATTNDVFYGTAPKYANKGKGGKQGKRGNGRRDGGNPGGDGGNHGQSGNGKSGANNGNRNGSSKHGLPSDVCPYQFKKHGCYRKNCNLKHGTVSGTGGPQAVAGQVSNVNTSMHATNRVATPMPLMASQHPTMVSSHPNLMPPSQMVSQPMTHAPPLQMNSHFMNHTDTNVSDPDFLHC